MDNWKKCKCEINWIKEGEELCAVCLQDAVKAGKSGKVEKSTEESKPKPKKKK